MNSASNPSLASGSPSLADSSSTVSGNNQPSTDRQLADRVSRFRLPSRLQTVVLGVPALLACGISTYLAIVAFTKSTVAGCGGGIFDCSHVLTSKWSSFLGMPVALLAAVTWAGILAALTVSLCSSRNSRINRTAWLGITVLGMSAGLAALWFVSLQIFAIGHYCPWCLVAHSCGLFVALVLLLRQPFAWPTASALGGVAVAGLALVVTVQVLSPEPPKYQEIVHEMIISPGHPTGTPGSTPVFGAPAGDEESVFEAPVFEAPFDDASCRRPQQEFRSTLHRLAGMLALMRPGLATSLTGLLADRSRQDQENAETAGGDQTDEKPERRLVSIKGGRIQLDARQWPLIGSPDAEHIFVEMFDYGCPHCRKTHTAVREACQTMGDDVAIIVLPVPLNRNCNETVNRRNDPKFRESCELSRLAVACWRVSPQHFREFHDWMFEGSSVPSYASAKQRVDELVGRQAIDEELARTAASKYIAKHVELYKAVGQGNVPKLLFPGTSIEGEFTSGPLLVEKIRTHAR